MASETSVSPVAANAFKPFPRAELRIVLGYIICASLWIVYSDIALDWLEHNPVDPLELQTFKGLNFVITTAVLLYIVLRRSYNRWRRAEQKLRESEERFELAGRAATDAIWDWNLVANTVWWSESFHTLFGYAKDEVAPTTEAWNSRVHPDDKEATIAAIRRVLESGQQMWAGEYRFRRKDGSYAFVQDRGHVIRDTTGSPVRVVGGMTDITPRKQAEQKVERARRQLRLLSARLQSLREEERTRIAREIHDELGQTLTGLKMDLRWAEKRLAQEPSPTLNPVLDKLVEAGALADATIASVQRISAELRPSVLEDLGLTAALRHELQKFQERTGLACHANIPDALTAVPRAMSIAVFRIFQETLTNVARHAAATEVQVRLTEQEGQLLLQVADNGRGIHLDDLDDPKSLGLIGMKERAELLGGEVTLQANAPRGTVVALRVPLPGDPSQNTPKLP